MTTYGEKPMATNVHGIEVLPRLDETQLEQ